MLVLFHLNFVDGCESVRYVDHVLPTSRSTVMNVPSSRKLFCTPSISMPFINAKGKGTHPRICSHKLSLHRLSHVVRRSYIREHVPELLSNWRRVEHHTSLPVPFRSNQLLEKEQRKERTRSEIALLVCSGDGASDGGVALAVGAR